MDTDPTAEIPRPSKLVRLEPERPNPTRWQRVRGLVRSEQVIIIGLSAVVGIAAAYAAVGLKWLISAVTRVFFWTDGAPGAEDLAHIPWYWILLAPAVGGLIVAQITRRLPLAAGGGVTEVIESVALANGRLPAKLAPIKAIASAITLGSGGSAGREGPIVQIGACIGSYLAQVARLSSRNIKTLLGCGVAGGVAATFNTPFAGAFVALEVILGDFGTVKLSPIVIASVLATVVGRAYEGNFPHIDVPAFEENVNLATIWPYLLLGVVCGLASLAFIYAMRAGWKLADQWPFSPSLLPAFGGLITGGIALGFPEVLGVGYEIANLVMADHYSVAFLLVLFFAKTTATAATVGTGGAGGTFAPSLFLGIIVGRLVGEGLHTFAPGAVSSAHAYAVIGMGAMLAASFRAPISAILIVFELTNNPDVVLPLMAAVVPSALISAAFHPDSIYSARLTIRGISIKPKGPNLLRGLRVSDSMRQRIPIVEPGTPLMEVVEKFLASRFSVIFVVDKEGMLRGLIKSHYLGAATLERESLLNLIVAIDISEPPKHPIHPQEELTLAMNLFADPSMDVLAVVDEHGRLLGDLLRSDVLEAYERELAHSDALSTTVDAIGVAERRGQVSLGEGYALVEHEAPPQCWGKTLVELDIRRRCHLHVVMVKRGANRIVPRGDMKIQEGDVLFLTGETERLTQRLAEL